MVCIVVGVIPIQNSSAREFGVLREREKYVKTQPIHGQIFNKYTRIPYTDTVLHMFVSILSVPCGDRGIKVGMIVCDIGGHRTEHA